MEKELQEAIELAILVRDTAETLYDYELAILELEQYEQGE